MSRSKVFMPFVILFAVLAGCATVPPPPPYMPHFLFTPVKQGDGRGISIALISPTFSVTAAAGAGAGSPEDLMRRAIGRSLMEYFTDNGFTVSGPFAKVDDMTFPEKKQADLLLATTIDVTATTPPFTAVPDFWGNLTERFTGFCTLSGTVSFVLWEPLSMQRMWAKDVDVSGTRVDCSETGTQDYVVQALTNDNSHLFEAAFPKILRTAEKYFHPDEIQLVKRQSLELRQKKVF